MHDVQPYSNFPFSEDRKVDLCDLMPPVFALAEVHNFKQNNSMLFSNRDTIIGAIIQPIYL